MLKNNQTLVTRNTHIRQRSCTQNMSRINVDVQQREKRYAKILAIILFLILIVGLIYEYITPMVMERQIWLFRLTPFNLYPTDLIILPITFFLAFISPRIIGTKKTSRWVLLALWCCTCAVGVTYGYFKGNPNLPADIRNFVIRPILAIAIYRMAVQADLKLFINIFIKLSIFASLILLLRRVLLIFGLEIDIYIGSWGVHTLLLPYSFLLVDVLTSRRISVRKFIGLSILAMAILQDFWKPVVVAFILLHGLTAIWFSKKYTREKRKINYGRLIFFIVLVSIAFTALAVSDASYYENFRYQYMKENSVIRDLTGHRLQIWESALDLWAEEPILGTGFGKLLSGYILSTGTADYVYFDVYYVHNISLQILYQTGLIGAFLLAIIFIRWLMSVTKTSRSIVDPDLLQQHRSIFIFILIALFIAQIGESINNSVAGSLFWIAIGIEAAIAKKALTQESGDGYPRV